jgi:hypothetical protein
VPPPSTLTRHGLTSVCGLPHAQAKGVGQANQGQEFAQLVVARQVAAFQVKAVAFEVLKTLLYRPALRLQLSHLLQARRAKEEEKLAPGQGFDPYLPPHPIGLGNGQKGSGQQAD